MKTFYVLKHCKEPYYLLLDKWGKVSQTKDVQESYRFTTAALADHFKAANMRLPTVWDVVPVQYDTSTGKVVQ